TGISQSLLNKIQIDAWNNKNSIEEIYPANSLQQGFMYHALTNQYDEAYREQLTYDYHYAIDIDKYLKSWELCIQKFPALRIGFNWEEHLIQVIYAKGFLNYLVHDISHLKDKTAKDKRIEEIQIADRKQGFDLTKPSLFRIHIIRQSSDLFTIIKTEHHSISDGWSGPIIYKSHKEIYNTLIAGKKVHVIKDRAYLSAQYYINKNKVKALKYWEATINDLVEANNINPILSKPINLNTYTQVELSKSWQINIGGDTFDKFKRFSLSKGITTNVILQFAWHKILQVYSSSSKTTVGTTISGRDIPIENIEDSVGLFINTLPLVVEWNSTDSVEQLMQKLQKNITEMGSNSFAELAKIQTNGQRLFHSLFVFENYPSLKKDKGEKEQVLFRSFYGKLDYPLSIMAYEKSDSIHVELKYDGNFLDESRAKSILEKFDYIVDWSIHNPTRFHSEITILNSSEYDQVVK
ncbi:condensation domain-containing protein, partial [Croceitalea sp. MTPC5]|uniref:condensation domain-containing protein n=1 Tax=Croceitalea sp. MTPC5 TaxID=3056565 RepID=UPI0030CD1A33